MGWGVKGKAALTHGLGMWTAHKGREKEPEPARDRKRQLTKEPRRRTTSAPRTSGSFACLRFPSWKRGLPGVCHPAQATTSGGTGKGVRWGSELSLCRTSCPA